MPAGVFSGLLVDVGRLSLLWESLSVAISESVHMGCKKKKVKKQWNVTGITPNIQSTESCKRIKMSHIQRKTY